MSKIIFLKTFFSEIGAELFKRIVVPSPPLPGFLAAMSSPSSTAAASASASAPPAPSVAASLKLPAGCPLPGTALASNPTCRKPSGPGPGPPDSPAPVARPRPPPPALGPRRLASTAAPRKHPGHSSRLACCPGAGVSSGWFLGPGILAGRRRPRPLGRGPRPQRGRGLRAGRPRNRSAIRGRRPPGFAQRGLRPGAALAPARGRGRGGGGEHSSRPWCFPAGWRPLTHLCF